MNKQLKTTIKEEGDQRILEITEEEVGREFLPTVKEGRAAVTGFCRSDGNKNTFKFEPFFTINEAQEVQVTTRTWGKISVSIYFFNETQNLEGPTLPQAGGSANLNPGFWHAYTLGSMEIYPTPSGIEYRIDYT